MCRKQEQEKLSGRWTASALSDSSLSLGQNASAYLACTFGFFPDRVIKTHFHSCVADP